VLGDNELKRKEDEIEKEIFIRIISLKEPTEIPEFVE
jgi:hypothetical protein